MKQTLSQRNSRLIDAIRFPLLLMVVFSHCVIIRQNTPISFEMSADNLFHFSELFFRSIGAISVAGFALISGYFFFLKEDFTLTFYKKSILKRKNSLLYPYILWNTIAFLLLWAKITIAQKVGFTAGVNPVELSLVKDYPLIKLFLLPIDGPLWYIRDLIVIVLVSPFIGLLLRYLQKYSILLFIAVYLIPINLGLGNHIVFFFCVGAYLAKMGITPIGLSRRLRWFGRIGTLIFFIALELFCTSPYYGTIRAVTLVSVVVFLFNAIVYLDERMPKAIDLLLRFTPAVFFIYAVHTILIINLVRGSLYQTALANNGLGQILITLITGTFAVLLSYLCYVVMKKIMPKTLAVLCGGRA